MLQSYLPLSPLDIDLIHMAVKPLTGREKTVFMTNVAQSNATESTLYLRNG